MNHLTTGALALGFCLSVNFSRAGEMKPFDHLRQAKAKMFDDMANCLKSEKTEAGCEKALKEQCAKMGGMKHCGMSSMESMASKGKKMAKGPMGNMGGKSPMPGPMTMPPKDGMGMEDEKGMMGGEM